MTDDQIKELIELLSQAADGMEEERYTIPDASVQVVRKAATALSTLLQEQERLREAITEEREFCAQICDDMSKYREDWNDRNAAIALIEAADQIRARSALSIQGNGEREEETNAEGA